MATTTKGNTKEATSKTKADTEKGASAKSTAAKATTKSTTKTTASKTTASKTSAPKPAASKASASKAADSKTTANKTTGTKKSAGSSKSNTSTRDHDTIRAWVEKRGGVPSMVKSTGKKKDEVGILRIDFPGYSGGDSLQEISWDEFFQKFDESKLEFLYQEKTADGKESRFNKFVSSN
ncbi:hypothetical protein SAMN05216327_105152 [Dyadobacter sp. SG02]|uniref:hypothetical protein n=1 Tax=Dyadobacter sp. SG02 TaxID=1855291 RepID=UPI0008C5B8D4|nr:hypothetical protein [Dyadobacter sp. SG02]SEI99133.1 hypothetical protein SAMN05216327_105152 [Dyadobacter sp. SG02]